MGSFPPPPEPSEKLSKGGIMKYIKKVYPRAGIVEEGEAMNKAPWYVIVRRCAVMPIVAVGIGLLALGMYIGWGWMAMRDALSWMPSWK